MKSNYLAGMIEDSLQSSMGFPKIRTADDVRDFSTPDEIARKIEASVDIQFDSSLILNLCSGVPKSVRMRVLEEYPEFPMELLLGGQSEIPYLVGSPDRMKEFRLND